MINNGAMVPPEVPLASDIVQEINFITASDKAAKPNIDPLRTPLILSYPTPNVRGAKYPTTPIATPPIAGHHIQ